MKLSQEAYKKAADELAYRKNVLAPKLGELIVESAAQGDGIHDNVQLRDTRNEIQVNLDVIARLEELIRSSDNSENIDESKIAVGSKVKIEDIESGRQRIVHLANSEALNFVENGVSVNSPIGSALLGKKVGDFFEVLLPNGLKKNFEIIETI